MNHGRMNGVFVRILLAWKMEGIVSHFVSKKHPYFMCVRMEVLSRITYELRDE